MRGSKTFLGLSPAPTPASRHDTPTSATRGTEERVDQRDRVSGGTAQYPTSVAPATKPKSDKGRSQPDPSGKFLAEQEVVRHADQRNRRQTQEAEQDTTTRSVTVSLTMSLRRRVSFSNACRLSRVGLRLPTTTKLCRRLYRGRRLLATSHPARHPRTALNNTQMTRRPLSPPLDLMTSRQTMSQIRQTLSLPPRLRSASTSHMRRPQLSHKSRRRR